MADIQNQKYGDLYTNLYPYQKHSYDITTIPSTHTYRGTVEIPAGLTQKGTGTYPLIHAKDVQIGNIESDRLNDKLADYDVILRELYGRAPSQLENKPDGRTNEEIATLNQQEKRSEENNNLRARNGDGLQSLDKIATVLNNRTETIDDRLLDLRIIKTITFGAESEASANPRGTKEDIIADNNSDTLTISPSNKWVKIFSSAENNSFTIGHLVPESIPNDTRVATDVDINHKANYNFNNNINGFETNDGLLNKFDVDRFQYDDAGHIIAYHKHTYELPKGFKFIAVNISHSTDTDNKAGMGEGTCEAGALADTLTLYMGNKWINIAAQRAGTQNNANNCITFSHKISPLTAGEHRLEYTTVDQEPAFGATFNIAKPMYSFTTDEAGHVTAYSSSDATVTVKIPLPSLTDASASGSDVITQLSLVASTGALSTTRTNIGALTLTDYAALNTDPSSVSASDSLNLAIAKLQKQIDVEVVARTEAITAEVTARNDAISAAIAQEVSDRNGAITTAISAEETNRNNAITTAKEALYGETIPATDALTLKGLAEQKLDKQDFEDFKLMYNDLIEQLATDLSWTDERKAELQFNIQVEEEPPENTGE